MATFYARYEKALRSGATGAVVEGRLQGAAPVVLADLAHLGDTRTASATYELFGPGDVERLAAGAVTRRFPTPGTSDAEETKLPLVELSEPDLPWRYTPAAVVGTALRPWLVLVVGRRGADEIVLRPDGRVTLGTAVQGRHALGSSWQWAHVHEVGGHPTARIICPVDLLPTTDYVACLVPSFTAAGQDAWTGASAVTLSCYDRWTFRTGAEGDFPTLAGRLRKADLAAIEAEAGLPFGRAVLTYQRRTPPAAGETATTVLATAGALRLPPDPDGDPDPADVPPEPPVAQEVSASTGRIVTPDGRGVVTAPRYDAPFRDPDPDGPGPDGPGLDDLGPDDLGPDAPPEPVGWVDQLRGDPRSRGAAGLGAWAAIEWQDRIGDAAAAKAGDLQIARDRIRHVALGIEASRSLWRRRVPADPVERLAVLAPSLGRLPTDTPATVLDRIAGRTPQLGPALLSSAARRALRPGPARTALAQPGAGRPAAVLVVANECPQEADDPADVGPAEGADPAEVARAVQDAVRAAAGGDDDLAERVLDRLGHGYDTDPALLVAALRALAPGPDGHPDPEAIADLLDGRREYPQPDLSLTRWPGWMEEVVPPEPCRPLDLGLLAGAVSDAVDPTVDRPPAARRVLATLPGITRLGPVEIEPELDLPLWSFLSGRSPDWMLPGADTLPQDRVVALSTNPAFVQALLAGANHQTTAELRWRNVPLVSRWSPLRKFWQRPPGAVDITPIKGWPDVEPLGSPLLADDGRGAEAVVAFRTTLFRRYPATVVYLYEDIGDWQAPPDDTPLEAARRKDPTFTGTIGDDIVFFGFPVPPAELATHWVVLEEPPAGYRFYQAPLTPDAAVDTAADYGYKRFAAPVRVLIGPLL